MMDQETQRVFDLLRQYVQAEQSRAERLRNKPGASDHLRFSSEGRAEMAADLLTLLDTAELQLSGVRRIPTPTEAEKP